MCPCVVDLATMREAVTALSGDPEQVSPLAPAELVIDHSVILDFFGNAGAFEAQRRTRVSAQRQAVSVHCVGARALSAISKWCRPAPASSIR